VHAIVLAGKEHGIMRSGLNRFVLCLLIVSVLMPQLASFAPHSALAQTASTTATTTDRLNLRAGPALSYGVITVIPLGARVTLTGQDTNGYRAATYNGRSGWAFATYLSIDAPSPSPNDIATTTDRLNLRSGPGTSFGVVTILPIAAIVTLTGETRNGYRSVTWGAYSGWVSSAYLDFGSTPAPEPEPIPDANASTTDALNLRTGPGTAYSVILVMPRGSRVVLTGQRTNGYRAVTYNGRSGWAAEAYIAVDGTVPLPTETARTTDRLNLRAAPETSSPVLTVIPGGAAVTLTGQRSNGFRSVKYNGYTGWAFDAYLTTATTPTPAPTPTPPPVPAAPFDVTNTIIGPSRGSAAQAIAFARRVGAGRMDEVERYINEIYRYAPQIGFDPAILVAQSALETGYWKSDWWRLRLNPAGLGITGDPAQESGSPIFASGTMAARAQMAHMHAEVIGNAQPLPQTLQGIDPTYQRVFAAGWAGTIRTLQDLSGTWAVDPLYAEKIVRVAKELYPSVT
jgi:uncharacterized protein YraI